MISSTARGAAPFLPSSAFAIERLISDRYHDTGIVNGM